MVNDRLKPPVGLQDERVLFLMIIVKGSFRMMWTGR